MATAFGRYELVSKVAATQIEELWNGRDTVLERSVFLKVAAATATDEQRSAWSTAACAEARALANLSCANIVMLLDVDEETPCRFLVFEHASGPTFAERLVPAPVTITLAGYLASELADACNAFEAAKIALVVRPECIFLGGPSGSKVINLIDCHEHGPKGGRELATMACVLVSAITGLPDVADGLAALPIHVRPLFERAMQLEGIEPYANASAFADALNDAARTNQLTGPTIESRRLSTPRWQNVLLAVAFIALIFLVLRAKRGGARTPLDQLRTEVVKRYAPKPEPVAPKPQATAAR